MTIEEITKIILSAPSTKLSDIEKVIKNANEQLIVIGYSVYNSSSVLIVHNTKDNIYIIITKYATKIDIRDTTGDTSLILLKK